MPGAGADPVGRAGLRRLAGKDHRPGRRRRPPPELGVDEVGDPPEEDARSAPPPPPRRRPTGSRSPFLRLKPITPAATPSSPPWNDIPPCQTARISPGIRRDSSPAGRTARTRAARRGSPRGSSRSAGRPTCSGRIGAAPPQSAGRRQSEGDVAPAEQQPGDVGERVPADRQLDPEQARPRTAPGRCRETAGRGASRLRSRRRPCIGAGAARCQARRPVAAGRASC